MCYCGKDAWKCAQGRGCAIGSGSAGTIEDGPRERKPSLAGAALALFWIAVVCLASAGLLHFIARFGGVA